MDYSKFLKRVAASSNWNQPFLRISPELRWEDVADPIEQKIRALIEEFRVCSVTPQATFDFERKLAELTMELARVTIEWTYNHLEEGRVAELPVNVEFDGGLYTRVDRKTPQEVATLFGKIQLERLGYRSTDRCGDPTIFPLAQTLGLIAGATPALAERAAFYQAEAGATQLRTLQRLWDDHQVKWGAKKLREVIDRVSTAMSEERHQSQVEKLLELLKTASESTGSHKPVLSVGRDGVSLRVPVKGGKISEIASVATITVIDRRGKRLGTVYLGRTPESKQGWMSDQLTRLIREALLKWNGPLPRLCYVTDSGDNETTYYDKTLRRMRHPRTKEKLHWTRVADYYHVSERVWTMAEAIFGEGPARVTWAHRMLRLLKKPNGVRRVLNSASVLRARHGLSGKKLIDFNGAYNYLRERTRFMRYAAYKKVGIPLGSGVTEAACKTVFTQRLKLSGMRWTKEGAQKIVNLRVLLLSGVWDKAFQRVLAKAITSKVPPYGILSPIPNKKAA